MSKWLNNELLTMAVCIASEVSECREPSPETVERFKEAKEARAWSRSRVSRRADNDEQGGPAERPRALQPAAVSTMNDELRDRIAARLELGTFCCELCWESAKEVAEAIIDDLGLVVEERIDIPGRRGISPAHRVVGRAGETCREYLARVTAPGGEVNGGEAALE